MSKPAIISITDRAIESTAMEKFKARVLDEVMLPNEQRYERAHRT